MEFGLLKTFSISILGLCLLLLFIDITATLNVGKNFLSINAQQENPCPNTMTMGATYVDKQGCIQPCPTSTSNTQGEVPPGCPQISTTQEPAQSTPPPQPPPSQQTPPQQPPLQPDQNGVPMTNNNNNPNTSGNSEEIKKKIELGIISPRCLSDLSGTWQGNDGGTYLIKQTGNKIVWFGSNIFNGNANGLTFANIANGQVNGSGLNATSIALVWEDVNIGDTHQKGNLILNIDPSGAKLTRQVATGGFAGTTWTRSCSE